MKIISKIKDVVCWVFEFTKTVVCKTINIIKWAICKICNIIPCKCDHECKCKQDNK